MNAAKPERPSLDGLKWCNQQCGAQTLNVTRRRDAQSHDVGITLPQLYTTAELWLGSGAK